MFVFLICDGIFFVGLYNYFSSKADRGSTAVSQLLAINLVRLFNFLVFILPLTLTSLGCSDVII